MEDDDDDFYGNGVTDSAGDMPIATELTNESALPKDEAMDTEDNEGDDDRMEDDEDEDDDDDDDDVLFTLEKPEGVQTEPTRSTSRADPPSQTQAVPSAGTNLQKELHATGRDFQPRAGSAAPAQPGTKTVLTHDGKEGKDFPEIRSSKIDLNTDPIWPGNGKPITDLDIDADLAEHSKPWRITGTDQTDYFNYGFDEYTWTMYCLKQKDMRGMIDDQKASEQQMKAALGIGDKIGGMPAMPSATNIGGMPDMFNPEQMMQQMIAQGINPANMDFNQFMQMAGQMGGPGMPGPTPGHAGGFGSGQNSASPAPGAGQGFQPPTGPGNPQSMQGSGGMEGYSPQQLAIMQEQQGMAMGGGGRGRGRRGRGYY